jgi:GDP-L-fucose synthase
MAVREQLAIQSLDDAEGTWFHAGSKDADLRDEPSTSALFQRVKPTHVLHLAAHVGGLFANIKHQVEFWSENMAMQENIFQCCKKYNVKRLVSCLYLLSTKGAFQLKLFQGKIIVSVPTQVGAIIN